MTTNMKITAENPFLVAVIDEFVRYACPQTYPLQTKENITECIFEYLCDGAVDYGNYIKMEQNSYNLLQRMANYIYKIWNCKHNINDDIDYMTKNYQYEFSKLLREKKIMNILILSTKYAQLYKDLDFDLVSISYIVIDCDMKENPELFHYIMEREPISIITDKMTRGIYNSIIKSLRKFYPDLSQDLSEQIDKLSIIYNNLYGTENYPTRFIDYFNFNKIFLLYSKEERIEFLKTIGLNDLQIKEYKNGNEAQRRNFLSYLETHNLNIGINAKKIRENNLNTFFVMSKNFFFFTSKLYQEDIYYDILMHTKFKKEFEEETISSMKINSNDKISLEKALRENSIEKIKDILKEYEIDEELPQTLFSFIRLLNRTRIKLNETKNMENLEELLTYLCKERMYVPVNLT